jgi:hypothetical protein
MRFAVLDPAASNLTRGALMNIITYRGTTIALINAVHFSGGPGVGAYQLIVKPTISMQQKPTQSLAILALGGVLRLGRAAHAPDTLPVIAPLHGQFLEWRCLADQSVPLSVDLAATLSAAQVRALDLARSAEGDLDVAVQLQGQVTGPDGPLPTAWVCAAHITASDWKRVLREMQFEDRATFEVPVDGDRIGPPYDKAAKHMRDALDQVQKRDWKDALTACREVLDELGKHQSVLPTWPQTPDWSKATSWDVPERSVAMQWAVRHLTHAGAHAKIGNADEHEVRMAVAMTGAVLRYYASR